MRRGFKAVLQTADASGGLEIPLYAPGSSEVIPLLAEDELVIHQVFLSGAPTGDWRVYLSSDGTDTGDWRTVLRHHAPANDGIDATFGLNGAGQAGGRGHKLYLKAPAGSMSVIVFGVVIQR